MQEALKNEEKIFTLTAKGEKERRQLERQSISEKQKYFFSIKFIIKKNIFCSSQNFRRIAVLLQSTKNLSINYRKGKKNLHN